MAAKNAAINRAAVEVLDVQPDDRVLEIGFGPGVAIREIASRARAGLVAGVDLSEVMLAQASARNRAAVRAGRVILRLAGASALPFSDRSFDKVCAINSFHHWPAPASDLAEVRRVLADGGQLLLCLRMEQASSGRLAAPGISETELARIHDMLTAAGFSDVRVVRREAGRQIACLLASPSRGGRGSGPRLAGVPIDE